MCPEEPDKHDKREYAMWLDETKIPSELQEKAFRAMTGLTLPQFYVKVHPELTMKKALAKRKQDSPADKEIYQKGLDKLNKLAFSHFVPKPKRPLNAFALYVQKNIDKVTGNDRLSQLRNEWNQLSKEEKLDYHRDPHLDVRVWIKYKEDVAKWKKQRVEDYLKYREVLNNFKFDPKDPTTYE
ncbi:hypothetical protein JA1_000220 [Spathaspora sp. JA1]|nr:hypothetical protein JA1_000220 [Spathaspora sp. JA1]